MLFCNKHFGMYEPVAVRYTMLNLSQYFLCCHFLCCCRQTCLF